MVTFTPWRKKATSGETGGAATTPSTEEKEPATHRKWNLGILSDAQTDEVPGMLFYKVSFTLPVNPRVLTVFFRFRHSPVANTQPQRTSRSPARPR